MIVMAAWIAAGAIDVNGYGIPEVGWSTGWIGVIFIGIQFVRGKLLTEKDHLERMANQQAAHAATMAARDREIDRVEHDRQEWRAESRIKDAQIAEKDTQAAERDRQLASIGELARTMESVLTAIRPLPGGDSP